MVISDKSQGSVAQCLRCGGSCCKFAAAFSFKEFEQSFNVWQSYWQENWLPQAPSALQCCPAER